ncbi:protein tyrosine phosphatase domain-containing protein 1-like, partial [Tropilaelaps mercedesae]
MKSNRVSYILSKFLHFSDKKKKAFTLWQCLENQNKILHGLEQRHLRYVQPETTIQNLHPVLATPPKSDSTVSSADSENIELNNLAAFYQHFIGATYDNTVWRPATTPILTSAPSSAASQQQITEEEIMVSGLKGLLESTGLYSNVDSSDDSDVSDEEVYSNIVIINDTWPSAGAEANRGRQNLLEKNAIYRQLMASKAVGVTSQIADDSGSCANFGRTCLPLPFSGHLNKVAPISIEETHKYHEHSNTESNAPQVVELGRSLNEAFLQTNGDLNNYNYSEKEVERRKDASSEIPFFNGHQYAESGEASTSRQCALIIAKCLLFQHSDLQPSFWLFIQKYKRALNEDAGAWERLRNEPNPCVVSALLWAFLESALTEPVLSSAELTQIVLKPKQPASVLQTFPK